MPNIKPVSDLRNYGEVLRDVAVGRPVFLTRNGHGRYAILDMEEYQEYERMKAMQWLMGELEKGRRSGEEEGYFTLEEVEKELGIKYE
ncbi:MAG: prevent-host-death protein [Oscillibacter sp.]|nr:prevent-host-death protein [Oscillibacter sp.]